MFVGRSIFGTSTFSEIYRTIAMIVLFRTFTKNIQYLERIRHDVTQF